MLEWFRSADFCGQKTGETSMRFRLKGTLVERSGLAKRSPIEIQLLSMINEERSEWKNFARADTSLRDRG